MNWFIAYFLAEIWNHRRNRFIAVGGTTVVIIFLMFFLMQLPETPMWLTQSFGVICGVMILATVAMMCYYVLKFTAIGCIRLWGCVKGKTFREITQRKEL